jgi:2-keto-4-pentenoate hydratase/2-oxohepta-3-ene-1,7-dioic acid hydratase in catechol pathway
MRLVTFRRAGDVHAGALLDDESLIDLHAADPSIPDDMIALLEAGDEMMNRARAATLSAKSSLARSDVTLEAPVRRPRKVLAIGLNYRDHAQETNAEIPKRPVVFAKMPTCITGPGAPVHLPKVSTSLDWEGELCFIIGTRGRDIAAANAMSHVAGFCNGNDLSVRDWQFHSPTWMMGKGFDTHGPIGPWLVTPDDIPDVNNLDVSTYVNNELVQHSNTSQLIFDVGAIVEYLSAAFTLEPGDVVFTGTPAGVGVARKPPRFLKAGDVVRVEISGLGVLENHVIAEPDY